MFSNPGAAMQLWHYTVASRLPAIIESGEILLATAYVPAGVRPIVWCSLNQEWEETANKFLVDPDTGEAMLGTKETTHQFGGGLARIGVRAEAAPVDWKEYKRTSGERAKMARELYQIAIRSGAKPSVWRGSFSPIKSVDWVAVEVWDGQTWQPYPGWTPTATQ